MGAKIGAGGYFRCW